jgi:adenosylhomocysteine nucleosidase
LNVAGVVAALTPEARALGPAARRGAGRASLRDGTLVAVSGMGGAAAAHAARGLIEAGATALVSWGMAGALDPELNAGAVCVPYEVVAMDGTSLVTARHWREPLAASIATRRPVACGKLLTTSQAIDTVAAKQAAYRETGAAAVDMESFAVAQVAATHGMPFIAVRVIVDTAADRVPRAILAASQCGRVQIWRLIWGLVLAPADVAPLIRLTRRYRVATRSLRAVAGAGPLVPPACIAAPGGGAREADRR